MWVFQRPHGTVKWIRIQLGWRLEFRGRSNGGAIVSLDVQVPTDVVTGVHQRLKENVNGFTVVLGATDDAAFTRLPPAPPGEVCFVVRGSRGASFSLNQGELHRLCAGV